jgi:hypothetical protein
MKIEINFYKSTGKWYTKEEVDVTDLTLVDNYPFYKDMDYTVHIVESDGFLQPYRLFKR